MPITTKPLLILDVDETLIYAAEMPLDHKVDFILGQYHVYCRPQLNGFLQACQTKFQIAFWSSSTSDYLGGILRRILPDGLQPVFVWGRERCVRRYDPELQEECFVKDLQKVRRLGYELARVLIVDDTPAKVQRNYGNAVYVSPFYGDTADDELPRLSEYLMSLAEVADVRQIEKRGWKYHISR